MYKFEALLKQMIWGSESWQISGVAGNETIVACGEEKGKSLKEIFKRLPKETCGYSL